MIITDNSFVLQRRWVLYDRSALSNHNWSRDPDLFGFSAYVLKCIYDILHILPLLLLLNCNRHCVLWNSCTICLYSKAQMLVIAQRKGAAYCYFWSFLPIWFLELLENSAWGPPAWPGKDSGCSLPCWTLWSPTQISHTTEPSPVTASARKSCPTQKAWE